MDYAFVDNYRGFSNTLVPLKDVNFLVGENSTGKTSFLGLMEMLSIERVLFSTEIDLGELGISTFADMISIDSNGKKYICVGGISLGSDEKPGVAFCADYKEKEGMPTLDSLLFASESTELYIKFGRKQSKYRIRNLDIDLTRSGFKCEDFKHWVDAVRQDTRGFRNIDFDVGQGYKFPTIYYISVILDKNKKNDAAVDFDRLYNNEEWIRGITWLAPIRSKPKKTYDEFSLNFSPEGNHTPYLIRKRLDSQSTSKAFKAFMERFGVESSLYRKIEVKKYGKGAASPFELDVVLDKHPLSISSVGYGVSQALPVVVEMFSRSKGSWFAIQQPEVHLHPKAQAALGEVVFKMCHKENKKFLIETHSDFMIDRFRIRKSKEKCDFGSQVLFFERTEEGNRIHSIEIDSFGQFSSDQPSSYRDFFLREEIALLGI